MPDKGSYYILNIIKMQNIYLYELYDHALYTGCVLDFLSSANLPWSLAGLFASPACSDCGHVLVKMQIPNLKCAKKELVYHS
jgi:hypothetical protein